MGLKIRPLPVTHPFAVALVALVLTLPLLGGRGAPAPGPPRDDKGRPPAGRPLEVRFTDGSVLKLRVVDDRFTLKTPYGKLVVPFGDVQEIEFATRIPDEDARRIAAAVADLASTEFKKREQATAELARLGPRAYPALLRAEKEKDTEVQRRARHLLEKVRNAFAAEDLEVRRRDVVHTEDSKFSGEIEEAAFRAETAQFGGVRLKLSDVRSVRSPSFKREGPPGNALPDPGNLQTYLPHVGKTFSFQVTGAAAGSLWGSDVYTLDSTLAMAAVHAGAVKVGQAAVVRVKILGPQNVFQGAARNGVASAPFGFFAGSYTFVKK